MRRRDEEEAKHIFEFANDLEKSREEDSENVKDGDTPDGQSHSHSLKYESLFNLIIAFIMQRPDIGYLPVRLTF